MRWQQLSYAAACLPLIANAIFVDDAFHVDYHHALLGVPLEHATLFHRPQITSDASLLYTISDKAVLGAIKPKDGSVVWRQQLIRQLADNATQAYLAAGREGIVFSGYRNVAAAWDALDGRLLWDFSLPEGFLVKGLQAIPQQASDVVAVGQDVILLSGPEKDNSGATISRIGGVSSNVKWEYKDTSISYDADISIATSPQHVFYISKSSGILASGKVKVVVIDTNTGTEVSQYSVALDSYPLGLGGTYTLGSCSGSPILASSEKPFKFIKLNLLGNTKVTTLALEDDGDAIETLKLHVACGVGIPLHVLIHASTREKHWVEVHHIDLKTGEARKSYTLPAMEGKGATAATSVGDVIYFAQITNVDILLFSTTSNEQLGKWTRSTTGTTGFDTVAHAAIEVSARSKSNLAIRAALTTKEGEWSLLRNGEEQWSRPEMLTHIVKAVWVEDDGSSSLAEEIQTEAASNPVSAYLHRWSRHAKDLTLLPQYLAALPEAIMKSNDESATSVRRNLIGGKLILAVTSHRQLLAIDAAYLGAVRWKIDLSPQMSEDSSIVHLLAEDDNLTIFLSNGLILIVDILARNVIETVDSGSSIEKVVILPSFGFPTTLSVTKDGVPQRLPKLLTPPAEGNTVVTINDEGNAAGWTVGNSVQRTWTIHPTGDLKFVHATSRPAHDPVASIGKVLGDRSVLYKYISPNLALLTALSSSTLSFYLINSVTGSVLHTSSHDGVLPGYPMPSIMSEHWFACSFTIQDPTTSGISTQIIISEMYESEMTNDRGPLLAKTNYSSFSADAGAGPFVLSQAYSIATPISNFSVSQTLQGITSRHLIASAPDIHAIVSIPRFALDARRPVDRDVTANEAEEGLFKYSPILDIDPKYYLSHSRQVIGIDQIMTTPTLLESTSMIFAYGHDVFGTQVSPSNAYDILGKGFKRIQLLLTVFALFVGVSFLRPFVRRKMVERRFI